MFLPFRAAEANTAIFSNCPASAEVFPAVIIKKIVRKILVRKILVRKILVRKILGHLIAVSAVLMAHKLSERY